MSGEKKYIIDRVGGHTHARLGPLVMNVCHAQVLTDADMEEYIARTVQESRGDHARVSLSHYAHHIPNARQRQVMFSAMKANGVPSPVRQCLLSDSAILRGAMTAFGWLTGTDSASYSLAERRRALSWLAENAAFDPDEALVMLDDCFRRSGLPVIAAS